MDGLECSEISLGDLEFSKRMDAEYYRKLYLSYEHTVELITHESMGHISDFLIGPFGSAYNTENYLEYSPYRYIRGQDVKPFVLKDSDPKYIAENDYIRLSKYALREKDIMVSVVGTLGNACIVREKDTPAIFSCKSTVIRTKTVYPEYLVTYLNSKYGQQLLLRKERGAIQKGLNLDDLKGLPVPVFSDKMQKMVASKISDADMMLDSSKLIYFQSEQLLLSTLEMDKFTPSNKTVSVKNFSDSVAKSNRLDAEYYQPKYEQLLNTLKGFRTKTLGGENGIVSIKKSIEPGSDKYGDEGIPFIRVSDITKFGIARPQIKLPPDIISNPSSLFPQKDTILMSKDGSVGIAYKVEENVEAITSGALLHLTIKEGEDVLPDYLTLVMNSDIVQFQAERDASGAIIQHWKPSEIEDVTIPILDMSMQKQIAKNVKQSFSLRRKSEQLLENVKQAVEIAIEEGENKAIEWLKENGGER